MSFTETQLIAIEAAIADGTLRVEYNDKVVVYRSLDEMLKIRDLIRKSLGLTSPCGGTRLVAEHSKGLC